MQGVKHMLYRESTMFTHIYKLVRIDDSLECARVCAPIVHTCPWEAVFLDQRSLKFNRNLEF